MAPGQPNDAQSFPKASQSDSKIEPLGAKVCFLTTAFGLRLRVRITYRPLPKAPRDTPKRHPPERSTKMPSKIDFGRPFGDNGWAFGGQGSPKGRQREPEGRGKSPQNPQNLSQNRPWPPKGVQGIPGVAKSMLFHYLASLFAEILATFLCTSGCKNSR